MLKKVLFHPPCLKRAETRSFPGFILNRESRSTYHKGYASLASLPAALLGERARLGVLEAGG
jgi:hypothetical protein